jgi:hypothetical protein
MGPDIGAIVADKNSHIADEPDAPLLAISPKLAPLLVEGELDRLFHRQLCAMLGGHLLQRRSLAMCQPLRPLIPRAGLVSGPQNVVVRPVVQPRSVQRAIGLESSPLLHAAGSKTRMVVEEVLRGLLDQRLLHAKHAVEVDTARLSRQIGDPFG